jgi:hypothetical protein
MSPEHRELVRNHSSMNCGQVSPIASQTNDLFGTFQCLQYVPCLELTRTRCKRHGQDTQTTVISYVTYMRQPKIAILLAH